MPPRKLRKTLARKTDLLGKAQETYLSALEFNDAQWGTAALYRIGAVFEAYAITMRDNPVPKSLSESDQELYRNEVDNVVIDIEERAIERYRLGYEKALELQVYNEFTKKIREALGRLSPSSFPPEAEQRGDRRIGDRVPEPKVIIEVIRDDS